MSSRPLLGVVLIAFGILSAVAIAEHGVWGILGPLVRSTAAGQVLADLVIALGLVLVWLWHDARTIGRTAWPWIVATLLTGSFGPLVYLLTRRVPARAA